MTENQNTIIHSHIAAERAIDELRRQMGIILQEDNETISIAYPVEFLTEGLLSAFLDLPDSSTLRLLITGARARSLGHTTDGPQAMHIEALTLSWRQIQALADPLADKKDIPAIIMEPASEAHHMLLMLAKYASLLPAFLVVEGDVSLAGHRMFSDWQRISSEYIRHYVAHPLIDIMETAHATLPVEGGENSTIVSFRSRYSAAVHLALIVGDINADAAPLTRIHSACVTGDILGSLRCDCGDQLKLSLAKISEAGNGLLVYLHQEGRGIGITNKLRAYRLQEQGADTYDANLMLGFEEDERDFSIAAAVLRHLKVNRIRLLTNNPHKLAAIEKAGIMVSERVPLIVETGRHNHAYLDAKAKKSGHWLNTKAQ